MVELIILKEIFRACGDVNKNGSTERNCIRGGRARLKRETVYVASIRGKVIENNVKGMIYVARVQRQRQKKPYRWREYLADTRRSRTRQGKVIGNKGKGKRINGR